MRAYEDVKEAFVLWHW